MTVTPRLLGAIALGCTLSSCDRVGQLEHPTCDANATTITDSSMGPLYLGEAVSAMRVRCDAVLDTTVVIPMVGWVDTVPAKRLVIVGVPVLAIHEGDKIIGLRVASAGLQTNDSIAVGTSIARFKGKQGIRVTQSSHSLAPLLQDRAHCGMTFELSGWGSPLPATEDEPPVSSSGLAPWPESIVVSAIVVSGCKDRSNNPAVDSAFDAVEDSASNPDTLALQPLPTPTLTPQTGVTPARPITPAPIAIAPSVVPTPSRRGDTTAITATASELAELRRQLDVPVQGLARTKLRDTYAEARGTRVHEALDILAPRGTPVVAATDGKLLKLFNSKSGGLMVYASDAADRFVLLYGHLDRYADGVREGMPLKRGQVIGYVGSTGNAPIGTPHLHFGIHRGRPSQSWWRGTPVNPFTLLAP